MTRLIESFIDFLVSKKYPYPEKDKIKRSWDIALDNLVKEIVKKLSRGSVHIKEGRWRL